jgi:hypothetical protein
VDERQKAELRRVHVVQVVPPARPSQAPADGRLVQERFKNARHVRAMIDKRVPS